MAAVLCFIAGVCMITLMVGYQFTGIAFLCVGAICIAYGALFELLQRGVQIAEILIELMTVIASIVIITITAGMNYISCNGSRDNGGSADYAIVFGAAVIGTTPSKVLNSRIEAAVQYANENPETVFVVSGGLGVAQITEAEAIKRGMVERGVDPARILLEEEATSSEQNIDYSLEIIRRHSGGEDVKLTAVSNEFHLYRLRLLLDWRGYEADGFAAQTRPWLLKQTYTLREVFAVGNECLGVFK